MQSLVVWFWLSVKAKVLRLVCLRELSNWKRFFYPNLSGFSVSTLLVDLLPRGVKGGYLSYQSWVLQSDSSFYQLNSFSDCRLLASIVVWLSPQVISFSSRVIMWCALFSSSFRLWASFHLSFSLKEIFYFRCSKNPALKALVRASHFHDHLCEAVAMASHNTSRRMALKPIIFERSRNLRTKKLIIRVDF